MSHAPLTVLQLTHQGDGAGSTQSILNLSQHLQRRGHRVLLGCRAESLLARLGGGGGRGAGGWGPPPAPPGGGAGGAAAGGGGRGVLRVAPRRRARDVLRRALAWLPPRVVLACVGVEPDAGLAALAAALPP